jgi:hypothetical protein
MATTGHHVGCDCEHHQPRVKPDSERAGWVASLLPVLACAVCPACLSAYAKVLSAVGVGLVLTETQHAVIMTVAVASSVGVSGWRSWRARRAWPFLVSLTGAALVVAGHLVEVGAVEWAGVLVLLVGGLAEMPLLRRLVGRRPSTVATSS